MLNLLPLPGPGWGHLMYYLWEAVTGRSISDAWMEAAASSVAIAAGDDVDALFNDITRLFG